MRRAYQKPEPRHLRATTWCFDWWNESISRNHWLARKSWKGVTYLKVPWNGYLHMHRKLNKNFRMPDSQILERTCVDDGIRSPSNVIFLFPFFLCIEHFQFIVNVLCFSTLWISVCSLHHNKNPMVVDLFCIAGMCLRMFCTRCNITVGSSEVWELRGYNLFSVAWTPGESWIRPLDSVF